MFGFPGQTGAEVHRASTKLFVVPAGTLPVPDRLYSLFLRHLPALAVPEHNYAPQERC